jgi:hypothetical protein
MQNYALINWSIAHLQISHIRITATVTLELMPCPQFSALGLCNNKGFHGNRHQGA